MEEFARILAPYGYDYMVSATSIPGPGNTIVVFATLGDFMAACVTADCCGTRERKVLWVLSCGGSDEEGYTHEANLVHRASRELFVGAGV
jgi:hypothetical protein